MVSIGEWPTVFCETEEIFFLFLGQLQHRTFSVHANRNEKVSTTNGLHRPFFCFFINVFCVVMSVFLHVALFENNRIQNVFDELHTILNKTLMLLWVMPINNNNNINPQL
ncbi:hypothetical protein CVD19_17000 [Bacillus sp. T33-2]|nr:hypothetical protein CVD19_17000 [Bacillus sp. T33-2]